MALLDPLFRTAEQLLRAFQGGLGPILVDEEPETGPAERFAQIVVERLDLEQPENLTGSEFVAAVFEGVLPVDDIAGFFVDVVEEGIIQDLQDEGELRPENVERVADATEGGATAALLGFGALGTILESLTAGQVDGQTEFISQALAGLGLDDVTGLEMDARIQEGIKPALEAKVAKEHRARFVDLQDAVELALRNKQADEDYLAPRNATDRVQRLIGSENPVNENNLVEEWGIKDTNVPILEEVAIKEIEFEELLETPSELGLPVPEPILERELDRAGYAEDTKEFLSQTASAIRRTARTYQELLTTEQLVGQLDTLAEAGVISPQQAVDTIPEEVPADEGAFEQRFQLLQDLPAGAPSATDFEGAFASGYISLDELRDRLDQTEYPVDQFEAVLRKTVLDELDGDLQEAVGLGLVSEAEYSDFAEFAGLDDETVALLLQGQSFGDITTARLQEATAPSERAVGTIVGIGESRARALDGVGIETVQDLAQADTESVAEAAQVSPETAEQFIQQAQRRVQ